MISMDEAKKIAQSIYNDTIVIKTFEFKDFYVFQIDNKDYNGQITPGMPLIQVLKESGKYDIL